MKENNIFVSVILCNYNYEDYIAETIESVLIQTYKNFELIIVDDGSTDKSRDVINSFDDSRIMIIFQENKGQAAAFNSGFRVVKGEIICFLDSDDKWKADKLSKIISVFKGGDYCMVQHPLQIIDKKSNISDKTHPNLRTSGREDILSLYFSKNDTSFFSSTSGIACRKKELNEIFPLNEKKWNICADAAITRPLPLLGEVFTLKESLGYYRVHGDNYWYNTEEQKSDYDVQNKCVNYTNFMLKKLGFKERINIKESVFYINKKNHIYESKFLIVEKLYKQNEFVKCKKLLQNILRLKNIPLKFSIKAFNLLGDISEDKNKQKKNYFYYKGINLLIKKKHKKEVEFYWIASFYKKLKLYDNAKFWFDKVIKQSNDENITAGSFFHIGEMYFLESNKKKAKKYFKKCLEVNVLHNKAIEYLSLT